MHFFEQLLDYILICLITEKQNYLRCNALPAVTGIEDAQNLNPFTE